MNILKTMAYSAVAVVATYNAYLAADVQQVNSDLTFDTIELTATAQEPGGDTGSSGGGGYYVGGSNLIGRDSYWWESSLYTPGCGGYSYTHNSYSDGNNSWYTTTNTTYDSNCNVTSYSYWQGSNVMRGPQSNITTRYQNGVTYTYTTTAGTTLQGTVGYQTQMTVSGQPLGVGISGSQSLNGNITMGSNSSNSNAIASSQVVVTEISQYHCQGWNNEACCQGTMYSCSPY